MKVLGVGIDFEPVASFRKSKSAVSNRMIARVFSKAEISYCRRFRNPAVRFAARFCAKEAAVKAVRPLLPVTLFDFEIRNDRLGAPKIRPRPGKPALRRFLLRHDVLISLTHTDDLAAAVAILVRKGKAP
jgi:holo-[acyl-carrier protein] synthase